MTFFFCKKTLIILIKKSPIKHAWKTSEAFYFFAEQTPPHLYVYAPWMKIQFFGTEDDHPTSGSSRSWSIITKSRIYLESE
jgi:hypothetical protein